MADNIDEPYPPLVPATRRKLVTRLRLLAIEMDAVANSLYEYKHPEIAAHIVFSSELIKIWLRGVTRHDISPHESQKDKLEGDMDIAYPGLDDANHRFHGTISGNWVSGKRGPGSDLDY